MAHILFICGCQEPGRDGIGDYTRYIATELQKQGIDASIIAFNDKYIDDDVVEETNDKLSFLRLSAKQLLVKKMGSVQQWIDRVKPDVISLQYVPYGFNKRGLPFRFPTVLKQINYKSKLHIMFHELWLGESKDDSFKEKLIGFLQKKISLRIAKQSSFNVVFTNTAFYKKCFNREGVEAELLPIFNSLPVGKYPSTLFDRLPQQFQEKRKDYIIGCFFGATHFHSFLYSKVASLQKKINAINKKLVVIHVGKGKPSDEFIDAFKLQGIEFIVLGEQFAADVADLFACVDLGLSTYPKILYQKSSSMASMLNNGLPVVLLRSSFEADNSQINEVKEIEEITSFAEFVYQSKSFSYSYSAEHTVKRYIELLG